jgi:F0F1-type ATP synthase membrane subunit a
MGALLYRKGLIVSILFSSAALSLGMIFLTYIVGISGFEALTRSLSTPLTLFIFFSFSLVYTSIWNVCLRKFMKLFGAQERL